MLSIPAAKAEQSCIVFRVQRVLYDGHLQWMEVRGPQRGGEPRQARKDASKRETSEQNTIQDYRLMTKPRREMEPLPHRKSRVERTPNPAFLGLFTLDPSMGTYFYLQTGEYTMISRSHDGPTRGRRSPAV